MTIEEQFRAMIRDELRPIWEKLDAMSAARESASSHSQEFISVHDAAALASVSVSTVREWIRGGRIRRYGEGRVLRVRYAELIALLSNEEAPPSAPPSAEAQASRILAHRRIGKPQP